MDVAGRPGIGFVSPAAPGGVDEELIFDPHTYHLMGDDQTLGQKLLNGTAILHQALVSGPGAAPQGG